jgi:hypothetical protein
MIQKIHLLNVACDLTPSQVIAVAVDQLPDLETVIMIKIFKDGRLPELSHSETDVKTLCWAGASIVRNALS